ncbi:unnamed protein product [Ilex paraguariensis]|uniref:Cotton fiber protein n=1 Tax=Ilex paraguariensis TaxID=185542 RepID=A0ABC8SX95_9AQUA
MRKPIIPRLISLKKSSKLKKFELLKHYNYGYIQEIQFSPSNSPFIHYHRKPLKKRRYRDLDSILFMSKCLGRLKAEGGERNYPLDSLEPLPANEVAGTKELWESLDSSGEEDSVDERAERFIEKFYKEIRMQRQKSIIQHNGMLGE